MVAITYDIPTEECSYEITATVEGNETKAKTINYIKRPATTVDFGMMKAEIAENATTITAKYLRK